MRAAFATMLVAAVLVVIPAGTAVADPLSDGCGFVNDYFSEPGVGFSSIEFPTMVFAAGEVVTLAVSDPSVPGDLLTLSVDRTPVATRLVPGALSYSVTADGEYEIWGRLLDGAGTWTGFCSEGQLIDPGAIIFVVEGLELPSGTENSFVKKLNNASKSLDKGDVDGACEKLFSFIDQVDAQDGKKLDPNDAADLRDATQATIDAIPCNGA
jgi:hypothetical protein